MNIEIKSWIIGGVLFAVEAGSLKAALEIAVSKGAHLGGADLGDADLRGAHLRDAHLGGADLGDADLRGADLRGAGLGDADLRGAHLRDADLRGADLRGAHLRDADLGGADLRGAHLGGADLRDAHLRGADLTPIRDDLVNGCAGYNPAAVKLCIEALRNLVEMGLPCECAADRAPCNSCLAGSALRQADGLPAGPTTPPM